MLDLSLDLDLKKQEKRERKVEYDAALMQSKMVVACPETIEAVRGEAFFY